jgi:SNF2 family DNA or RNA helicase
MPPILSEILISLNTQFATDIITTASECKKSGVAEFFTLAISGGIITGILQIISDAVGNIRLKEMYKNYQEVLVEREKQIDDLYERKEEYKDICVVINGETSQKDRQQAVEDFQNNPNIRLFIGNTVAAGVGLTLTAAEVVIVNDLNFTPANIDQSLDRAFRIGQTKNVICYFPLFDNTVDTIIYEVLDKKRDIINMAIDGVIDNKGVIEEVIDRLDEKFKK